MPPLSPTQTPEPAVEAPWVARAWDCPVVSNSPERKMVPTLTGNLPATVARVIILADSIGTGDCDWRPLQTPGTSFRSNRSEEQERCVGCGDRLVDPGGCRRWGSGRRVLLAASVEAHGGLVASLRRIPNLHHSVAFRRMPTRPGPEEISRAGPGAVAE